MQQGATAQKGAGSHGLKGASMRLKGLSPEQIESRLRRGMGRGVGRDYKSFIPRRAARSRGELTEENVFGTERQLLLMSRGERRVAATLWWDEDVLDVLESYALRPVDQTIAIARELGIRFPVGRNGLPLVRTIDYLVRHAVLGVVALSRKDRSDVELARIMQLLEIERQFARRCGWLWAAVTEDDVPETLAANLLVLNEHWLLSGRHADPAVVEVDAAWLLAHMTRAGASMLEAGRDFDGRSGCDSGTGLAIMWHQLAHKRWNTDLNAPLDARVTRPRPGSPAPNNWVAGRSFL